MLSQETVPNFTVVIKYEGSEDATQLRLLGKEDLYVKNQKRVKIALKAVFPSCRIMTNHVPTYAFGAPPFENRLHCNCAVCSAPLAIGERIAYLHPP